MKTEFKKGDKVQTTGGNNADHFVKNGSVGYIEFVQKQNETCTVIFKRDMRQVIHFKHLSLC